MSKRPLIQRPEVFRCFNHVESWIDVLRVFTLWYKLYLKRPDADALSTFFHVSLQMESMQLKRVEQAGKQRQSDIIPGESPEKFWPRFCFETFVRYKHCCGDRGCLESQGLHYLKRWSHYLQLSWAVTPMSTNQEVCRHRSDGTGLLSMSQMSMIQKLLSRFWSWVMTWPSLLFDYLVFTWLYPAGFFYFWSFTKPLKVIYELSQCFLWLMAPANHRTTKLMNLCKLNMHTGRRWELCDDWTCLNQF